MSRVLYIGSPFFGYYRHIIQSMRSQGFEVDFYNDRPGENPFLKGAIRVSPGLVQGVIQKYLNRILDETAGSAYDLIFVVNGKVLTPSFVEELRRRNPKAQSVLYLWDSIRLYPHVLDLFGLFDRTYTFDPADARAHPELRLLPLFYTDDYRDIGRQPAPTPDHDVLNVCTAHANRYELMKRLVPELKASGLEVYSYLYLNPLQFAYNKVRSEAFAAARPAEFRFRPLPPPRYAEALRRSLAVLDVNHSAQSGLTMRTLETVGARRKLITTNPEVVNEPFYDPSRILLIDPSSVSASDIKAFIDEPQRAVDRHTLELYGIRSWVNEIVNGGAR